jgi:arylsulfatase
MNVVILMNDQHGHDVLGCNGYGPLCTPTYDRLAADGIRFTQAVCATSPSLPSRHNCFHGLHAFQTGVYHNGSLMDTQEAPAVTMGSAFRDAGYTTAACGKMHWFPYHAADVPRADYFGFDYRVGHFHETGDRMDTHFVKEHRDWQEKRFDERERHGIGKGGDNCTEAFLGYESAYLSQQQPDWWTAGKAAGFIEAKQVEPLLLISSLIMPHAPHAVPSDFAGRYDREQVPLPPQAPEGIPPGSGFEPMSREDLKTAVANYMSCVSFADACHARVIEQLDASGLYDDTLIVFCSDHGELLGSRGPRSFSKYCLYEQAIRVPFIIKPPKAWGSACAGSVSAELVSLVDVLPTVLNACGIDGGEALPGIDLAPLLKGEPLTEQRPLAITEFCGRGGVSISARTADWKLILNPQDEEIYDIANDPYEFHNLAETAAGMSRIAEMKGLLVEELQRVFSRTSRKGTDFPTQEWSTLAL